MGKDDIPEEVNPNREVSAPIETDTEIIELGAVRLPFGEISLTQVEEPDDGFVYLKLRPRARMSGGQVRAFCRAMEAAIEPDTDTLSVYLHVWLPQPRAATLGSTISQFAREMGKDARKRTMAALRRQGVGSEPTQPYDPRTDTAQIEWERQRALRLAAAAEEARAKHAEDAEEQLEHERAPERDAANLQGARQRGLLGRVRNRLGRLLLGG